MNCKILNSAAEIFEAFNACKNPGEEIDLFECLATHPEAPIVAFVEILQKIKLEPILALTLQAFGKITDADVKLRLKQSDDLLIMLSEQARSGSTDLIRWAAATTIDKLGFDLTVVSQHLSEEPGSIAQKIMQSKIKRFADQNLIESHDYDEFLRFWIYGYWYKLKELTLDYEFWTLKKEWESKKERGWQDSHDSQKIQRLNKFSVCWEVMNALSLRGLNQVNLALKKAEDCGEKASDIDENEVFEGIAQVLSTYQLTEFSSDSDLQVLMETQFHCLESNNKTTRLLAARKILTLENTCLDKIRDEQLQIFHSTEALMEIETYNITRKTTYKKLEILSENIDFLEKQLKRNKVLGELSQMKLLVLDEMSKRKSQFAAAKLSCENFRKSIHVEIDKCLKKIQSISTEIYEKVFDEVQLGQLPDISVDHEHGLILFEDYKNLLAEKLSIASSVHKQVLTFYSQLEKCQNHHETIQNNLTLIKSINYRVYGYLALKDDLIEIQLPSRITYQNYTQLSLLEQYSTYLKNKLNQLRDEVVCRYERIIPSQLSPLDTEIKKAKIKMEAAKNIADKINNFSKILCLYLISLLLLPWTLTMMVPVGLLIGIVKIFFGEAGENLTRILGLIAAPGMLIYLGIEKIIYKLIQQYEKRLEYQRILRYEKLESLKDEERQILNLLSI
ncbi:hypothetical protein [Brasilonema octagenarum]|uniref:Uncharacterized protein n=1 Tax=Brasilonema octagenarum UFV-OR1 TaxID=417115 RepID=A0ABX1MB43_9CYAN|nr:hypothetical protein [Brasilonema octagenarum]NMF64648.1 hypothetical protein [Brasilonema octagenarum UFV-OR1]